MGATDKLIDEFCFATRRLLQPPVHAGCACIGLRHVVAGCRLSRLSRPDRPPAQAANAAQAEPSVPELLRDAKLHGPEFPVTVDQLRRILAEQHKAHKRDAEQAKLLLSFKLTERLTGPTLQRIQTTLKPGGKTRTALELLSDQSAFLSAPAAELPDNPVPDFAAQQAIVDRAVEFVTVRLKHLPDFMATRTTRNFNDEPLIVRTSGGTKALRQGLRLAGVYPQEITYRNRREVVTNLSMSSGDGRRRAYQTNPKPQLVTIGDFGGILATILSDAVKGAIAWSHWEQTAAGLAAVFDYRVPATASHYGVEFCCVTNSLSPGAELPSGVSNSYHGAPGYDGSLFIDPATGAILRMTLESEFLPGAPILRSTLWVQYGRVDIGGTTYVCPVRSGAVTFALSVGLGGDNETVEQINDVTFTDYHRFRASVKILDSPPQ